MKNIVFVAKTNLNNDGRILNQLNILKEYFPTLIIDFLLFPDKKTIIDLPINVRISEINTKFRNNKILRPLVVLESTYLIFKKLKDLKPDLIHVQDSAVVLPVFIYKSIYDRNVNIIYDDHELPNENISMFEKCLVYFEQRLMKISKYVIFANKERKEYLTEALSLSNINVDFFLNLPYYSLDVDFNLLSKDEKKHYENILKFKREGNRILLHQGPVNEARGNSFLLDLLKKIDSNIKVVFLGGNKEQFKSNFENIKGFERCYFVGPVQYDYLDLFWDLADASVVLYNPTFINNRLCAPNRYFISLFKGIPIIVNRSNPVLRSFNEVYKSGFYIEDLIEEKCLLNDIFKVEIDLELVSGLKQTQIKNFVQIYEDCIYENK